ncbi:MAG: NAD(P)-binding protein [Gammaproteobacteria bacterium]|nr:NAD(P)-binding protein [Gammaproteobacteria bacterium]
MDDSTRYDILFEPVPIGPVVAKNRFYQVPHCNGGGYRDPSAVAEMRRIKAEGGWGVVFTEQVEIHHTGEITPYIELHLWDDDDIPALAKMADGIHEFDALAGIELAYSGVNGPNLYSREVPMSATALPIRTFTSDPVSARSMTRRDIRDLIRWHRNAFRRAKTAGYDLICLYGAHGFGIIQHFLSPVTNHRTDEYGGSLKNRSRLMRELVSEARDVVGDRCAVTLRLCLDEMVEGARFSNSELRDLVAMHSDLPDLWDLAHGTWEDCSGPSRFREEGAQENLVKGIRELTLKPVVGVGRFTSPDLMVRQVRSGTLDFIGAARPSIAVPFLPNKIRDGQIEDIRECIGCNLCITGDMTMSLSRCTQNASFMEEWRKGWHPERFAPRSGDESVLVVGAGPAGMEAARVLGERGYRVTLAERETVLGGRVARERKLPGLSAWGRVADYREHRIRRMANVEIYPGSELTVDDVLEFGFDHVAIATGSIWRRDGVARYHVRALDNDGSVAILTPDDLMGETIPTGRVLVYDDDHYYMGGVLAELAAMEGAETIVATPAARVSEWTVNTLEQSAVHRRLAERGVCILPSTALERIDRGRAILACSYTGETSDFEIDAVVMVTSQESDSRLWTSLEARREEWADRGIRSIRLIGDALSPAPIAWAVYSGYRYAQTVDGPNDDGDALPFRREVVSPVPGFRLRS